MTFLVDETNRNYEVSCLKFCEKQNTHFILMDIVVSFLYWWDKVAIKLFEMYVNCPEYHYYEKANAKLTIYFLFSNM